MNINKYLRCKSLFFFIVSIVSLSGYTQKNYQISFEEEVVYIVARSTQSKEGLVASNFNIKDKVLSHIGIGYVEDNELMIYNISNYRVDRKGSSLLKETLHEFTSEKSTVYFSVWKYKPNKRDFITLKRKLTGMLSETLSFDNEFTLDNEDLYCSEFVFNILNDLNLTSFKPVKKNLGMMYSLALGRKTLVYIPVDFFLSEEKFKFIYEEVLNN